MEQHEEYKSYPLLETKSDEAGRFSGHAATFQTDAYGDRIVPGAFERTIKAHRGKIPIFLDHSRADWIGFSSELAEDAKGLRIDAALSLETRAGADTYALLKLAKDLDYRVGLSIGFIADKFDIDELTGARSLKAISLIETSITPFPANTGARVEQIKSLRNFESILRDAGCSKEGAKRALASLTPYLNADAFGNTQRNERDARGARNDLFPALRAVLMESK